MHKFLISVLSQVFPNIFVYVQTITDTTYLFNTIFKRFRFLKTWGVINNFSFDFNMIDIVIVRRINTNLK